MIVPLRAAEASRVDEVAVNTGSRALMTTQAEGRMILAAGLAFDKIV
jgi:hypothetical protein